MESKDKKIVKKQKPNRTYLWLAVCVSNLSSLALGITCSWSSPVIPKLNGEVDDGDNPVGRLITEDEESWIGSLATLGAFTGPYIGVLLADSIGRKKTLILAAGVPSLLSYLIFAFAKHTYVYYIARYIGGFAIGTIYTALPSYISEISEDENRGATGSAMNVFITLGLVWSYAVGPFVSIKAFNLLSATIPGLFVLLFPFFPESPYHYAAKGDLINAQTALSKVRMMRFDDVAEEMKIIKKTVDEQAGKGKGFLDLFRTRASIKALIICTSLVGFQQLSGINVVLFYSQTIFQASGGSVSSVSSTIIIGLVQLIPSAITSLVADSVGRRVTLLFSALGQALAELPLGIYFYFKEHGYNVSDVNWLPVTCLMVYIVAFRIGFGPLPWTIMAELFPQNTKTAACTVTGSFCYVLAFILTRYFQKVTFYIGKGGGFCIFGMMSFASFIFVWVYVPETKQKSFLEIQEMLQRKKKKCDTTETK